jgi:diguanylate cyclase (GGDEF)-like protein
MSIHSIWLHQVCKFRRNFSDFRNRSIILSGLITTAVLSSFQTLQITEPLELFLFDHAVRLRSDQPTDSRLLIVGLTDEDIANYGWPLPENILASLLSKLQANNPRVIGLDLYQQETESSQLAEQFAKDNVVGIYKADTENHSSSRQNLTAISQERLGFSDLVIDRDGIVRRSLLFVGADEVYDDPFYSFALLLTLNYLGIEKDEFKVTPYSLQVKGVELPILNKGSGGYQGIDNSGYQILLRYRNRDYSASQVSITDVLDNKVRPELIKNKIVILGSTNSSLKDYFYTPYSAKQANQFVMPGVFIHAQITSQLLDIIINEPNALYRFIPVWAEPILVFTFSIIGGLISWHLKRNFLKLISISMLIAVILITSYCLFLGMLWIPAAEVILGILLSASLTTGQRLLYQSAYDESSKLPKRDLFIAEIKKGLRVVSPEPYFSQVFIIFIGIDRIDAINKSLGYQAGEEIIKLVFQKIKSHIPRAAKIARLGDSEFAIFLKAEGETLRTHADQIYSLLNEPISLNDNLLLLNAHIGISSSTIEQPLNAEKLIQNAHLAMYQNRLSKPSKYTLFSNQMLSVDNDRLLLESNLLRAIEQESFLLLYQPIVNLKSQTLAGFEALLRWPQEDGSHISPEKFIPIAEETGLILPLGGWVIQTALKQLRAWKSLSQNHKLTISINLSGYQLCQDDLLEFIKKALLENNIQGNEISLEITENIIINDIDRSINLMSQLKALGVRFSIDDFGTGYSSLSYLHRLPLDTVKIDKSFINSIHNSIEDSVIVKTILSLSRSLNLNVVAEGIETAGQAEVLRRNLCEYGQGYFFGRPLTVEQVERVLENFLV